MEDFYASDSAGSDDYGNETELSTRALESVKSYSDVGVVVISRGAGGESSISAGATGETEDETYLGEDQGWAHEASPSGGKHVLELTESENDLLALAERTCKKVVVLYSASQVFEMGNLEDDENVNGVLWIGRPGDGGTDAVGEVLSGAVTPSGKTVDEWTRDLTNDPTYANVATYGYADEEGKSTGYTGIDYEEDVYLGYKYYETYWLENKDTGNVSIPGLGEEETGSAQAWYDYNVVYPFGYGLSYTQFSYELEEVTANTGSTADALVKGSALADSYTASQFTTSEAASLSTAITSMTATVTVTNEGSASGKETVQVYVQAPYESGKTEKPAWTLVGFGKTGELRPGASETLEITFNVQDFASFDYSDANEDGHYGYELDLGEYTIHLMESSSHDNMDDENEAYESATFEISDTVAHLDVDDFSGNEVEAVFSDNQTTNTDQTHNNQSDFYSMAMSAASGTMTSPLDATQTNPSTMLSRANFDGTKPQAPTSAALTAEDVAKIEKYDYIDADSEDWSDEGMIWEKTVADLDGWTQGTGVADENGLYTITLDDMSGLDYDDPQWVTFLNQLTWEEKPLKSVPFRRII